VWRTTGLYDLPTAEGRPAGPLARWFGGPKAPRPSYRGRVAGRWPTWASPRREVRRAEGPAAFLPRKGCRPLAPTPFLLWKGCRPLAPPPFLRGKGCGPHAPLGFSPPGGSEGRRPPENLFSRGSAATKSPQSRARGEVGDPAPAGGAWGGCASPEFHTSSIVRRGVMSSADAFEVRDNAAAQRFEVEIEGRLAMITYQRRGNTIVLTHKIGR